jgi:hypothetical protein
MVGFYCSSPWCFRSPLGDFIDLLEFNMPLRTLVSCDCMRVRILTTNNPTMSYFIIGTNNSFRSLLHKNASNAHLWTCMMVTFYFNVLSITCSSIPMMIRELQWNSFLSSLSKKTSNKAWLNGPHISNPFQMRTLLL